MKKRQIKNKIKPFIPSDCREVQKLNGDFIKGILPYETSLAFVRHIRHCSECMEELKAYFMFYSAVRYLNEPDESDMPQNIESMLKEVENEAVYRKKRMRNIVVSLVAFASGLGFLVGLILNGQF